MLTLNLPSLSSTLSLLPTPAFLSSTRTYLHTLISHSLLSEFHAWCQWEETLWNPQTQSYRPIDQGLAESATIRFGYVDHTAGPQGTLYHGLLSSLLRFYYLKRRGMIRRELERAQSEQGQPPPVWHPNPKATTWEELFTWYNVDVGVLGTYIEGMVRKGADRRRWHIIASTGDSGGAATVVVRRRRVGATVFYFEEPASEPWTARGKEGGEVDIPCDGSGDADS